MNKKRALGLVLLTSVAISLSACGTAATNTVSDSYTAGEQLGGGVDKNEGVVNAPGAIDKNEGLLVSTLDTDKDGTPNTQDPDIDNDGILNAVDTDIDGDGVVNIDDNDIDGDGIANTVDTDMDGDGTANVVDTDMDGDGILNVNDNDIDGDGMLNTVDTDLDGDGILNTDDPDVDGDGILNADDPDIDGNGIVDNVNGDVSTLPIVGGNEIAVKVEGSNNGGATAEGTLAYFSRTDTLDLTISSGTTGFGTQTLKFADIQKEATDKNADVSTIAPYEIKVQILAGTLSGSTALANLNVYYQLPNGTKTLLCQTNTKKTIADLVANGVSMEKGTLAITNNFASFQTLLSDPDQDYADFIVEFADVEGSLPNGVVKVAYAIKANAKVKL